MTQIELKYNGKLELISFPSVWNELTERVLLYVGDYWESWRLLALAKESLLKAKALLVIEIVSEQLKISRAKVTELLKKIAPEPLAELCHLTDFIFEGNTLTICPIKFIITAEGNLYPPDDALGNITIGEFNFADGHFMKYLASNDITEVENLIGVLYRTRASGKLKRLDFEMSEVEKHFDSIKKLRYAQRQLILLWYIGCREAIVKGNEDLFDREAEEESRGAGWTDLIRAMSKGIFGTFKETEQTDLFLVFMELRAIKAENLRKKEEMDELERLNKA